MRHLALLLLLASASSGQSGPPETACERDFPAVLESVQEHVGDGQDARDRLLGHIDRILERDHGQDTECLLVAREQRVVLTNVSERYAESVETATEALHSSAARSHIDIASGILRNKAIALEALGRQVEASQAYTDAAGLAPRLTAAKAVGALTNLANDAIAHGDIDGADAAQRRALRILRDSAATDPARMRVRTARLLTSRAYLFQQRLAQTTDPASQAATAQRLVAVADTAAAILSAYETTDPTEKAFDQGKRALALIDAAYGEAVLGRHDAARAPPRRRAGAGDARRAGAPVVPALGPLASPGRDGTDGRAPRGRRRRCRDQPGDVPRERRRLVRGRCRRTDGGDRRGGRPSGRRRGSLPPRDSAPGHRVGAGTASGLERERIRHGADAVPRPRARARPERPGGRGADRARRRAGAHAPRHAGAPRGALRAHAGAAGTRGLAPRGARGPNASRASRPKRRSTSRRPSPGASPGSTRRSTPRRGARPVRWRRSTSRRSRRRSGARRACS